MNASNHHTTYDPMKKEGPTKLVYKEPLLLVVSTALLSLLVLFQLSSSDTNKQRRTRTSTTERDLFLRFSKVYDRHPRDAFTRHVACIDTTLPDCNSSNQLQFVGPSVVDPLPNQFRYHATGPTTLQGVFWFKDQRPGNTVLASFAGTRQAAGGIATGNLNDDGAYAMLIRPRGDHNWAFAGEDFGESGSSSDLNEGADVTYEFEIAKGTVAAPLGFKIAIEANPSNCMTIGVFAFWRRIFYVIAQFNMNLLTESSHPMSQYYSQSSIWMRRSSLFLGLIDLPGEDYNYDAIQILNGQGHPIEPAYSEFVETVKTEYDNKIFFYGLKPDRVDDFDGC